MLQESLSGRAARVADALDAIGWTPERCARAVASVVETTVSQQPVIDLRAALEQRGVPIDGDVLERVLLSRAAVSSQPRVASLPVYEDVRRLVERELDAFAAPDKTMSAMAAGTFEFVAAAKLASLRRFPAGPLDWEYHGLQRSLLARVPWRDLPRTLRCLAVEFGGFSPAFFLHVAMKPRNRALVLQEEVRRAFYRVVRSMALQPEIKGILAIAWFLDPAAVRDNPHLAWLNDPFVNHGGLVTTVGPAPADAGFLERNDDRRRRFEAGALRYRLGLGIWPRAAALAWAEAHPELDR